MYAIGDENKFLEVTYQNGDKEILYFKDFSSGAMIENIVRRAKKLSIKRQIDGGERGICTDDLLDSIKQEFREHEDLPNTTNPDDWAKISGKKGERIVYVRTDRQRGRQPTRAAGRSNASPPASTCSDAARAAAPIAGARCAAGTLRLTRGRPEDRRHRDRVRRRRCAARADPNPVLASSMLINGYVEHQQGRLGLRGRVARPRRARLRPRRLAAARGRDPSRQRRAHERRPLLRRPRASRVLHTRVQRPAAARAAPTRRGSASSPGRCTPPAGCSTPGQEIVVYKNNSDGKGNSYGMPRELPRRPQRCRSRCSCAT